MTDREISDLVHNLIMKTPVQMYGPPHYNTDMTAVMKVVEKLAKRGMEIRIEDNRKSLAKELVGWQVWFDLPGGHTSRSYVAPTLPEAICKAALGECKI